MTGEMKHRKKGIHYVKYVSHGGTYREAEAVCGWKYPKHETTKTHEVTCPECLRILNDEEILREKYFRLCSIMGQTMLPRGATTKEISEHYGFLKQFYIQQKELEYIKYLPEIKTIDVRFEKAKTT